MALRAIRPSSYASPVLALALTFALVPVRAGAGMITGLDHVGGQAPGTVALTDLTSDSLTLRIDTGPLTTAEVYRIYFATEPTGGEVAYRFTVEIHEPRGNPLPAGLLPIGEVEAFEVTDIEPSIGVLTVAGRFRLPDAPSGTQGLAVYVFGVPEPPSLALATIGALGLAGFARRRRRRPGLPRA